MGLDAWHDFHVITGTAGATLVGLVFVVISVGPQIGARKQEAVRGFVSPTVRLFAIVLVISSVMAMPGGGIAVRGAAIALIAAGGIALMLRAHIPEQLKELGPEDALLYFVLPLLAHAVLLAAGVAIAWRSEVGLTVLGCAILALLAIGLRNAWDLVIYIARKTAEEQAARDEKRQRASVIASSGQASTQSPQARH
jgi:hypothetical protein